MAYKTDPPQLSKTKDVLFEPQYITAECVRQKKMANAASVAAQQNSKPTLPTFKPGSESSQIGEQKVEEILLLAK